MAYFAWGYVNTGYDENSATQPSAGEIEVICNIVYSIKDVITQDIINFNYSCVAGILEAIVDLKYTAFSELAVKKVDLPSSINALFENSIVTGTYTLPPTTLEVARLDAHYNIGLPTGASHIFVTRLNQND